MFRFNPRSRCNNSLRCCYRAREHVDPAWSRRIRHGGDSHPEMSSPGSVGLAQAHPLTKTQAMEPSRQTWSRYGPPYPLGRWSSDPNETLMLPIIRHRCEPGVPLYVRCYQRSVAAICLWWNPRLIIRCPPPRYRS